MSTGLACALLIYLWVNDELHVDKFHQNDSRLYQVRSNYDHAGSVTTNFETDGILAEALAEEMPEVEYAAVATPVWWFEKFTLSIKDHNVKATGRYASEDYFNIFSYKIIEGDKNQVLSDKNNIVISEALAQRLFNTSENVIGKIVSFQHEKDFQVSGVFKATPYNSTENFDFVVPIKNFQEKFPQFKEWDRRGPGTYLVLNEGTDVEHFNNKMNSFYNSKIKESIITLFVTPYSDNYLYGKYENGTQAGGRIEYVRLFSIIAIFIVIIACINFMNLSTAKASRRIKEVGIKKAIGADRQVLVFQYLGESMIIVFLSLILALAIVFISLPSFNELTGKFLSINFNIHLIFSIVSIGLVTGLLAGSYPAFYLSGFNPVMILKGKLNASLGEVWARKGLVVFQFTISIVLIVAVLVVFKQIEYVQNKNIGYDKDNVIIFDIEGKVEAHTETFISQIKNVPGIINASSSNSRLVGSYGATSGLSWEGKNPDADIPFELVEVNYDFFETLGMEMAEGRSFSRNYSSDSMSLIFNEAAIK
ncbi:MAG: ABC transporter permease, partial [Bacteroidota bacterium]|nr:ABC transporter permease [Bacteroidota bacterium]